MSFRIQSCGPSRWHETCSVRHSTGKDRARHSVVAKTDGSGGIAADIKARHGDRPLASYCEARCIWQGVRSGNEWAGSTNLVRFVHHLLICMYCVAQEKSRPTCESVIGRALRGFSLPIRVFLARARGWPIPSDGLLVLRGP